MPPRARRTAAAKPTKPEPAEPVEVKDEAAQEPEAQPDETPVQEEQEVQAAADPEPQPAPEPEPEPAPADEPEPDEQSTPDNDQDEDPEAELELEPDAEPTHSGPEPVVILKVSQALRGRMATRLLQAADELGYPRDVVRSQTGGFKIPQAIHHHLYPSEADKE